jgi:hypothetical protein
MDREAAHQIVRLMLRVIARIARKTRTPADDLMTSILQSNEQRLVDVVVALGQRDQPVTEDDIARALEQVGIKV